MPTKLREVKINVTTDGSGDSTDLSEAAEYGRLYALEFIDGDLADGVDITLNVIATGGVTRQIFAQSNWNVDQILYPRAQVHGVDGTALTLDGTRIAFDLPLISGIVQIVTAQGGNAKSGSYVLHLLTNG